MMNVNDAGIAEIVVVGTEPEYKHVLIILTMSPVKEGDGYFIDSHLQSRPARQEEACLNFFKRTLNMVSSALSDEEIEDPVLSKAEITAKTTKRGKALFKLTVSAVLEDDGIQFQVYVQKNKSSLEQNLQLFMDVIDMAWDVLEAEEW